MTGDFLRLLRALHPARMARVWAFFGPHLRPHRAKMAGAFALTLIVTGLLMFQPWPIKFLFDYVLMDSAKFSDQLPLRHLFGNDKWTLTLVLAGLILITAVARGLAEFYQTVLTKHIGQKVVVTMRMRLFEHVQRLSLGFHTKSQSGDILMRLTGDITNLRDLFVDVVISAVSSLMIIVALVGLMLWIDWRMTLLVLSVLPFIILVSSLTGLRIREAAHRQRRKESKISVAAHEALIGMPIIQAFGREDSAQEVFDRQTRGSFKEGMRVARLEAKASQWTEVILAIGTAIVVLVGTRGVLAEPPVRTPGDLLLFYFYLRTLNRPVRGFARLVTRAAKAAASAERVMEILETISDIADSPDAVEAPAIEGRIEFRNVSFSYEETPVLQGINLQISPGETVAVLGLSGSGKTTLCSLIARLYDPAEGQVLIDGVNIRRWRLKSLRDQIGTVLQDPMLFGTSVFDNIAFSKPDATERQVRKAARRARANAFIERLPEGYETVLAERGLSLSEGQKQRIALARSFLRRAPILILDEPTSNVDAESERHIVKALRRLIEGTTCLVITHNTRIIDFADRVVLIDDGRIAEEGTPDELEARGGIFARLRMAQEGSPMEGESHVP